MKKVLHLTLACLFSLAPTSQAAEIWSDAEYTEQTTSPSTQSSSSAKIFYQTYDEVKATGCDDAKFSLGEGWYCKDSAQPNTSNWTEPETTDIWSDTTENDESPTTDIWSEDTQNHAQPETTHQQQLSFSVEPIIENGVIYAPVQELAIYLGLAVQPLTDPKGIAVVKGDKEILYFFEGLDKYAHFTVSTEKTEAFQLPKAIQQKGTLTIVPTDILVKFAGGSMSYNPNSKRVSLNDAYSFNVTANSAADYTKQWTEPSYSKQWTEAQYTEQWTETQYTEQWADTPDTEQWMDTSKTENWSEDFEIPVAEQAATLETKNYVILKTDPINEKGRLLVPLRELFEMLGATVDWDQNTRTVVSAKGTTIIRLTIGSTQAYVNGVSKALDVPGKIVNGKTMIPLRFVSEALGEKVEYDAKALTVTVGNNIIMLPDPNRKTTPTAPSTSTQTKSNNNSSTGGMTDQQWETQKILDRYFNNSFNMTGSYRPSYQWNSGY